MAPFARGAEWTFVDSAALLFASEWASKTTPTIFAIEDDARRNADFFKAVGITFPGQESNQERTGWGAQGKV